MSKWDMRFHKFTTSSYIHALAGNGTQTLPKSAQDDEHRSKPDIFLLCRAALGFWPIFNSNSPFPPHHSWHCHCAIRAAIDTKASKQDPLQRGGGSAITVDVDIPIRARAFRRFEALFRPGRHLREPITTATDTTWGRCGWNEPGSRFDATIAIQRKLLLSLAGLVRTTQRAKGRLLTTAIPRDRFDRGHSTVQQFPDVGCEHQSSNYNWVVGYTDGPLSPMFDTSNGDMVIQKRPSSLLTALDLAQFFLTSRNTPLLERRAFAHPGPLGGPGRSRLTKGHSLILQDVAMPHATTPSVSSDGSARSRHRHRDRDHRRHSMVYLEEPEPKQFRFCAELTLQIRSRRADHRSSESLEDEILYSLTNGGIKSQILSDYPYDHPTHTHTPSYKVWTITSDHSIQSKPTEYKHAMKFVSPLFRFSSFDTWIQHFESFMQVLNRDFETTSTHECSTSIHLAPLDQDRPEWTRSDIRALSKSILYFESCLDAVMPLYRRTSVFAKSNRYNKQMANLTTAECFSHLDSLSKRKYIAAHMVRCDPNSSTGRALGQRSDFPHSGYRWNFLNLVHNKSRGTIEFRQPPGSTTPGEAIAWIILAVCFAQVACAKGDSLRPKERPNVETLGDWVYREAVRANVPSEHRRRLRQLFDDAMPIVSDSKKADLSIVTAEPPITVHDKHGLIWREKGERNVAMEKFDGFFMDPVLSMWGDSSRL
ncbi:putative amidoligase enzyme-domain-containing protein [Neurospora hispaniola]|uniref:Amidoligase enzyme-domain-containing protein n=1 Tax=Neurospora hispaniola TaxID=588809 RepID=A0AAJ0ID16_9PEZI|nr:putative amidoligase enzyme-domain-containing protein [Neurospora hispaniola]